MAETGQLGAIRGRYGEEETAFALHEPPPVAGWLANALRETLGLACPGEAPRNVPLDDLVHAVAAAVGRFLDEQRLAFATLPDRYLWLLAYRGLCAAGARDVAARWIRARLPEMAAEPNPFDPDVWPGPVPLVVWTLFDSRLVRPVRSLTADGRLMWMLDFRRLRPGDGGWLELTLLPGLGALVEQMAPAWDAVDGRGVLALRGLLATGFAPTPRRRSRLRDACLDTTAIRAYCLRLLSRETERRHWARRPDVVFLDAPRRE